MTLDEVEKLARAIAVDRKTGSMTFEATTDLACALLAVLPVVRAAEAQIRSERLKLQHARASQALVDLEKSMRQMRAALGKS